MIRTALLLMTLLVLLPGCVVFRDHAGPPVERSLHDAISVGSSTREQVLALAGAPTGTYGTNLLATLTRVGQTLESPATPGRILPDVYVWQEIDVVVTMTFFPVLFFWSRSEVTSRSLMVVFDEQGLVAEKAWREDRP